VATLAGCAKSDIIFDPDLSGTEAGYASDRITTVAPFPFLMSDKPFSGRVIALVATVELSLDARR
jgi:hypothetical protein